MRLLFQLGRQPELSLQEIVATRPSYRFLSQPRDDYALFEDLSNSSDLPGLQSLLGGTQRIIEVLGSFEQISEALSALRLDAAERYRGGKLHLSFLFAPHLSTSLKIGLRVKDALKSDGLSVRVLNREGRYLDPGSLWKEGYGKKQLLEYCLIQDSTTGHFFLGLTIALTDPTSYAQRDHHKPARDAKVGMLPPKLAQIMVNLSRSSVGELSPLIADPFCGTGTVLVEAGLMGSRGYAADLEPRLIQLAQQNHDALIPDTPIRFEVADARQYSPQILTPYSIVTEGWLGPVFLQEPTESQIIRAAQSVESVLLPFLQRAREDASLQRMVLLLPQWQASFLRSPYRLHKVLAYLDQNWHSPRALDRGISDPLVYRRPGQHVLREVHILEPTQH